LLANAVDQLAHVLADPPHSRASPLPHLNGVAA
jgi:phosphate starvation-inducible protein PhoH and related proteins